MADMDLVRGALVVVFTELTGGAGEAGWALNPNDPGLLRSLDKLSAVQASAAPSSGGASIAAHVDHLRYGLSLLNRWSAGEEPFADADYRASWQRGVVSDQEWETRRADLTREVAAWREAMQRPRELSEVEMNGMVASVVHLAYHLGAIRQIDRSLRGPDARD